MAFDVMSSDKEETLVRDFPHVFSGWPSLNTWDRIWCGDGWYTLLREMLEKLEASICALPEEERDEYRVLRIKEKFGVLRVYMSKYTEEMRQTIKDAREKSAVTCEECSAPGTLQKIEARGCVRIHCDVCWNRFQEEKG